MIIRSFANGFEVVDYSEEINLIPNTWGLIQNLGLFQSEGVSQNTLTIEKRDHTLGLLTDQVRGFRNQVNKDDLSKILAFSVPHFNQDDYLTPQDLQGKRAYGTAAEVDTEAAAIARKLERIRRNHAATIEYARCQMITAGTVYAPNGTVSHDMYAEFGVTKKTVDFVLGTATTEVVAKIEEVIAHIQDNIQTGDTVEEVVFICSPEFFGKLIAHAQVKDAYKFYKDGDQQPLRNRLGTGIYRTFSFGGATFIEYRGSYNGSRLIPANKAYALPRGSDIFKTFFGPANKFGFENTVGEEGYVFTYRDPMGEKIIVQTELNMLNMITRPQAVVEAFTAP